LTCTAKSRIQTHTGSAVEGSISAPAARCAHTIRFFYTHIRTSEHTNTRTHKHTHTHTYTHTYTYTHTHTHTYSSMYSYRSACLHIPMYTATPTPPPASTSSPSPASCGASGAHTHKEQLGPFFPPLPFLLRHHCSPTHSFNNSICLTHSFSNAGDKTKIKHVSDRQQCWCPCLSCPCVPVLHTHMSTHTLLLSGRPVGLWLPLWRHWQQLLRLLQSSNHCYRCAGPDRHHQHGFHVP
jgi:hypothetical protein